MLDRLDLLREGGYLLVHGMDRATAGGEQGVDLGGGGAVSVYLLTTLTAQRIKRVISR